MQDKIRKFQPEYSWEKGPIPSYALSNNSATIRATKKRIEEMKRVQVAVEEGPKVQTIKGVEVVENAEEFRIQLIFPDKPSPEVRAILKKHGFRWSPTNKAWQRHLNNAGRYAAQSVINQLASEED